MPARDDGRTYTFSTAEEANACFENISAEIGKFLQAIAPDLEALNRIEGYTREGLDRTDLIDLFRQAYESSFQAVEEYFESNALSPMRRAA